MRNIKKKSHNVHEISDKQNVNIKKPTQKYNNIL